MTRRVTAQTRNVFISEWLQGRLGCRAPSCWWNWDRKGGRGTCWFRGTMTLELWHSCTLDSLALSHTNKLEHRHWVRFVIFTYILNRPGVARANRQCCALIKSPIIFLWKSLPCLNGQSEEDETFTTKPVPWDFMYFFSTYKPKKRSPGINCNTKMPMSIIHIF